MLALNSVNAHNYKEHFAAEFSAVLNRMEEMGGYYRLIKLYSKPPHENVMATVMDDKVSSGARGEERAGHFIIGHCSNRLWEVYGLPGAWSCNDNFADAFTEIRLKQLDAYAQTIFSWNRRIRQGLWHAART